MTRADDPEAPVESPRRRLRRPVATDRRGLVIETAALCGLLVLSYAVLPLSGRNRWLGLLIGLAVVISVIPLVVRRVRRVLRTNEPVVEALAAVVVTATLAVIGSASTYYAMSAANPGQFTSLETKIDGVYFAVTVMTTTGFGDIVPTSQVARVVTTTHIIFTVALLGAAFRLIAWATKARISNQQPPDAKQQSPDAAP